MSFSDGTKTDSTVRTLSISGLDQPLNPMNSVVHTVYILITRELDVRQLLGPEPTRPDQI